MWRPRSAAVSMTDSKRRAWIVADRTGLDAFSQELPIGSTDANYRIFWIEDMVRAVYLGQGADRARSSDALMAQLRRSWRIDFPEVPSVSKSERMQQLYDRRGMGKR